MAHKETVYKPSEFANLLNVSVRTLQDWDRKGILVARRTPTNRRYYTEEMYQSYGNDTKSQQKEVSLVLRMTKEQSTEAILEQVESVLETATQNGVFVSKICVTTQE